jgi:colanic acid/amylovoran biosynthesis protein
MKNKKKILLTNSYAVNNGDMALVIALYEGLIERGYEVNIATFYYKFLKTKYPNLPLIRELIDYTFLKGGTAVKKLFLGINYFFNSTYRDHDAFIASPGGYMNSYYGLKRCLLPLLKAKKQSKKTAVYSQSVGPLNNRDRALLTEFSKSIDVILVRDDYSQECIASIPCHSKVFQTKDAAFLLKPRVSTAKSDCKTVAVSVREWSHDNRDMQEFCSMIKGFCETVLSKGFNIEFISTCQGVPKYRDDSKVAFIIKELILKDHPDFKDRITVDPTYHTYYELMQLLNTKYCFTIGTRLHMCILSLVNGTPAFNISYEVKGKECYKYLGLAQYSVDFNESHESALQKFNNFVDNYKDVQATLLDKILPVHEECKLSLDRFLGEMKI